MTFPFKRLVAGIASRAASVWSGRLDWGGIAFTRRTVSGISIDQKGVLSLSAAYCAQNRIATDVARLPAKVYRSKADGSKREMRKHPAYKLLTRTPDGVRTPMRFWQAMIGHMLGWGNGYAEIERDLAGRPLKLHILDPRTEPRTNPDTKEVEYHLPNGKTLAARDVIHIAGFGYDGLKGYSPVDLFREAFALGISAERFGASLFGNGALPGGVIEYPGKLSREAREGLRSEWNEIHQGADRGNKIAILFEGAKFNGMTMSPENAQFLATRAFQVLEICRIYCGIAPNKLGDYSQSHNASVEQANLDYLTSIIAPFCELIEQELNLKLFTEDEADQGYFVEHMMAALLRGDMKARSEYYTKLRDLGVLTPNMIARLENMNPFGAAGEIRLVPGNMAQVKPDGTILATLVKPTDPPPTKTPDPAEGGGDDAEDADGEMKNAA